MSTRIRRGRPVRHWVCRPVPFPVRCHHCGRWVNESQMAMWNGTDRLNRCLPCHRLRPEADTG